MRKLRLTGGEPLVRRGITTLFGTLSRHLASERLDELTLTTNGSQLAKYAAEPPPTACAVSTCRSTRSTPTNSAPFVAGAKLDHVIAGIDAAQAAGLEIKINVVALKG